jgi:hypothetical protein
MEDAALELWAANRHIEPFAELLGKPVRVEMAPEPGAPRPVGATVSHVGRVTPN